MFVYMHTDRKLKPWFTSRKVSTGYPCAFIDVAELHTPLSKYRRPHKLRCLATSSDNFYVDKVIVFTACTHSVPGRK